MKRILITGGSGTLGTKLTPMLREQGLKVRILSRRQRPDWADPEIEWVQASLSTGVGLENAVQDVDTVIHAASTPVGTKKVDMEGAQKIGEIAKKKGVSHLVYISIVGIDTHPMGYYKGKLATEKVVQHAGLPWTILRATQFHELLDEIFLPALFKTPFIAFVPQNFKFQVIDSGEVAKRLAELVVGAPAGRVPDIGGPQVLEMGKMAAVWAQAKGIQKPIRNLPLFGGTANAFRAGINTAPNHKYGKITWEDYLADKYS